MAATLHERANTGIERLPARNTMIIAIYGIRFFLLALWKNIEPLSTGSGAKFSLHTKSCIQISNSTTTYR
ncbi:MAG: hypothetical protein ACRD63_16265, partial [Pyrinomonadaceae bacterium]